MADRDRTGRQVKVIMAIMGRDSSLSNPPYALERGHLPSKS
ncbi:hypothetical protein D1AOALGA4SA_4129 [Olavius algarvensis Delta 1 endosymbiont]|nr:hypothetical protein D1AOALGA4SA_4129 [Olavius algarvensis Delta 1 endosymbiont]